ncbi:tetratricopeptide repeat protein [Laceyella sacchari]|uniref:tetratricopeptide repeat protein n=1 Tax=Laceyella sacchari TaxID=37482 RepID=UPI0010D4A459|nr:tetratricopeptide repeat protein [Laceyella sacchari]TCW39099.1 tetratricopeptide repeat protein [Laceyella sacchari]
MKKTHVGLNKKVVRLNMDAGFFFERAVRSLDRHRYDRAVKYFRLAMEKEPENPINHCNLAGILSELGRFEESNEVLEHVLNTVAPDLHECLFYMANNAANMGDLELAEDYLLEYLQHDPDGEFAEEAEEMLVMLAQELGRPPREPLPPHQPIYVQQHEEARQHLEQGRFLQAIQMMEDMLEEYPDFLAARNNLALAYYYIGEMEQALAAINEVLEMDPNNLHALCNLAVLSHHMGETEISTLIIDMLKKLIPLNQEHACKLATTLGILGEHAVAYELFARLVKYDDVQTVSLYHYAAVAAWNNGNPTRALSYWRRAVKIAPDEDVPAFHLIHAQELLDQEPLPKLQYHYQLPFEEQYLRLQDLASDQALLEQWKGNPLIRSSFFWALSRGDFETKRQVLNLLGWIADEEVSRLLEQFIRQEGLEPELKKLAETILLRLKGDESPRAEAGRQILACCLSHMADASAEMKQAVERLWMLVRDEHEEQWRQLRKAEGWAAALEYLVSKHLGVRITQKEVAEKYQVSLSSVSRYVKLLGPLAQRCFD